MRTVPSSLQEANFVSLGEKESPLTGPEQQSRAE
jgi:hypothetical protein